MKYLVLRINDDALENDVKSWAEFLLETAMNDEIVAGVPSPFDVNYFIGDMQELLDSSSQQ